MWNMPRSYYILYLFFLLVLIAFSRFFYRGVRVVRQSFMTEHSGNAKNTMIIGAGDTAFSLIKDMSSSWQIHNKVVCVIDADPIVRFRGQWKNIMFRRFLLRFRNFQEAEKSRYWKSARIPDVS